MALKKPFKRQGDKDVRVAIITLKNIEKDCYKFKKHKIIRNNDNKNRIQKKNRKQNNKKQIKTIKNVLSLIF